jgi:hypothetical protein
MIFLNSNSTSAISTNRAESQEIQDLIELMPSEIEGVSGGLLHIRKLPQITNSPDT